MTKELREAIAERDRLAGALAETIHALRLVKSALEAHLIAPEDRWWAVKISGDAIARAEGKTL